MFIDSQFSLNYDSQMIDKYFAEYTRIEVKHFRDTLLQHMGNFKKFVAKRTRHKRLNGIESEVQDESSRSGNDTNVDDADIRPIYDEEPMAGVQLTAECHIFPTGQQHTKWKPTGKLFDSCTGKVDSEPPHGSNVDISKIHEYKETLDLSAGTSINVQKKQRIELSAGDSQLIKIQWHLNTSVQASNLNVKKGCLNKMVQASHHNINKSSYSKDDSHDVNDKVGKSIRSFVR
ncbi:hypothetical protein Tco_1030445 [Tanacetum coccineum]|uniref:Uncharacterized protein n=1 Tax=Tanacetum coccineum TaxID=301880 RepID=A0ABQ5G6X0_9ASTR